MSTYRRSLIASAALLIAFGGMALSGCGSDSDTYIPPTPGGVCDGVMNCAGTQCTLSGTFCGSLLWEQANTYLLDGPVFIGDDANTSVLTIEPGTVIKGLGTTPPGMLVIRRHSMILAEGTAAHPIVFTSNMPVGQRGSGDWGGLILNGRAPVNECYPAGGCLGEGSSGEYGGNVPNDNSGSLKYVRVEFAGHVFTSDDELNGIAFQGVGSGTQVDYVQVHQNQDDGIEMFGGTVNLKHALVTGCVDDQFDWTFGWTGMAQYVVMQMWSTAGDNGIEADNNENNHDIVPRSDPKLANFTIVAPGGDPVNGPKFRRGTGVLFCNSLVQGTYSGAALAIDNPSTFLHASINHTQVHNTTGVNFNTAETETLFNAGTGNAAAAVTWKGDPLSQTAPDFRPAATITGAQDMSLVNPFFDAALYKGAMDGTTDWTVGWTTHAVN